jgi:2-polyprenyl-3-methyl-5-hydroxy-6-metoxy-1,4-benzoquinol methylase
MNELLGFIEKLKSTIIEIENYIKNSNQVDDFEKIKNLLNSWPEAVDPALMCDDNSEDDKRERGQSIIDMLIPQELKGLKFLDVGCGEGHCTSYVGDLGAEISIGYDIEEQQSWANKIKENTKFTTNFEELKKYAPFDVILIFDVIDHLVKENTINFFKNIISISNEKTRMYCRVHPFTSKHGSHLYKKINKAYLHLVLSPEEILKICPDLKEMPTVKVKKPLMEYKELFVDYCGLEIESKNEHIEKPDDFFKQEIISDRISKRIDYIGFAEEHLKIQFIDYVLKIKQ